MIPWSLIDTAPIPGGDGELRLMRRGAEFSIVLGPIELMNSRRGGSEEALAVETCRRLGAGSRPRVLIGGLGLGFTLRAALAELGSNAEVVVAELVPAVVAWARGPLAALFAGCLGDRRVTIVETDVAVPIGQGGWDAILLDVDNGPGGQTRAGNDGLYAARGLAAAREALRPGGLLSVWSAEPNEPFAVRMRQAGFVVEALSACTKGGKRGARHTIWIGRRL